MFAFVDILRFVLSFENTSKYYNVYIETLRNLNIFKKKKKSFFELHFKVLYVF